MSDYFVDYFDDSDEELIKEYVDLDEVDDVDEMEIDYFCYGMDKRNKVEIFRGVIDVIEEYVNTLYNEGLSKTEIENRVGRFMDSIEEFK